MAEELIPTLEGKGQRERKLTRLFIRMTQHSSTSEYARVEYAIRTAWEKLRFSTEGDEEGPGRCGT
jgi:hypothetical protein